MCHWEIFLNCQLQYDIASNIRHIPVSDVTVLQCGRNVCLGTDDQQSLHRGLGDEKVEAWGGKGTCPRSHSQAAAKPACTMTCTLLLTGQLWHICLAKGTPWVMRPLTEQVSVAKIWLILEDSWGENLLLVPESPGGNEAPTMWVLGWEQSKGS